MGNFLASRETCATFFGNGGLQWGGVCGRVCVPFVRRGATLVLGSGCWRAGFADAGSGKRVFDRERNFLRITGCDEYGYGQEEGEGWRP